MTDFNKEVKCAQPDCSARFVPKSAAHKYCVQCAALREQLRKQEYRKAHLQVTYGPETRKTFGLTREEVEAAHAEHIRAEQAGELDILPPISTRQPDAPRELSSAEISHLAAEPDISDLALDAMDSTEQRSMRLEAHRDWLKQSAKIESRKHIQPKSKLTDDDFLLEKRPERKVIDPVIETMRAEQGMKNVTLFLSGGFRFTRDLQGRPIPSQLRQDKKTGKWIEPDGLGGEQELAEGSVVTVRKIDPWPGNGFLLSETGVWYRPAMEIIGWTEAVRTPSGLILYADGSRANLRLVEGMYFDQFDRVIQVKDAPECPDHVVPENYYFTDEGVWVSKTKWLARDVHADTLRSAIEEAYALQSDSKALEAELEIYSKHSVTMPPVIHIPATIPTAEQLARLPVPQIKLPPITERPLQLRPAPRPPSAEELRQSDIRRAALMHDALDGASDLDAVETVAAMAGIGPNQSESFGWNGNQYVGADPRACREELRRVRQSRH